MGDRPQAIINKQLVDDADILVAVFWTKLGTATGAAMSGSVAQKVSGKMLSGGFSFKLHVNI